MKNSIVKTSYSNIIDQIDQPEERDALLEVPDSWWTERVLDAESDADPEAVV